MDTREVDVKITEPDGTVIFKKDKVEVPAFWSDRAATIAADKYLSHGEDSILTMVGRVVRQIKLWGMEQGYFETEDEAIQFMGYLENILLDQRASFNSPVWFNVGVPTNSNQIAACLIYGVEDDMGDILAHTTREGMTFKWGSGAGVNVSSLRASGELLTNKGKASGPISFMRIWDQAAGSIKSGGKTRRSAKLVCMDIDHPDIETFIECKGKEEKKAKILIASGIDPEEAYQTVSFQNSNHSVMISDLFMKAVENDAEWHLFNRGDKKIAKTVKARELFKKVAQIAWETGDPGVQFRDRINKDNPIPSVGPITSSNPCSEFMAVNNSACNLASLNLVKYLKNNGEFDWHLFSADINIIVTAQDIMINMADYPTPETRQMAMDTRPLGLGFCNLGALLMLKGMPYDSDGGRALAKEISKKMTTLAYLQSARLAETLKPYKEFEHNTDVNLKLIQSLTEVESDHVLLDMVREHGVRNSQVTLLAPTGTISFLMDCDTTGIEPLFALETYKQLSGGGTIKLTPECVKIMKNKYMGEEAATGLFDTANEISPLGHVKMMAACQPHLNGAISKTVNLSADATVENVIEVYQEAWSTGLKALAVYRDGSKDLQPLTSSTPEEGSEENDSWTAYRKKMPKTRRSITHKFNVGGLEGYITAGMYDDGNPGELFIITQNQGSTMDGILDAFATAISLALQYGVPMETLVYKFTGSRFDPAGYTQDEDIPLATSVVDYIFKWLQMNFIDEDDEVEETGEPAEQTPRKISFDGPPCPKCSSVTGRSGSCFVCPQCGETTGCS